MSEYIDEISVYFQVLQGHEKMCFKRVNELKMIKSAVSWGLNAIYFNKCWRLVDEEKTLHLMQIMIGHGPHYFYPLICISATVF